MFCPFSFRSRYPSGEEIAKAWWKEKDRRDEEAARKEREEREAKEEAQFWEELGAEMVLEAENDKRKPISVRYSEAISDGDVVGAGILYDKMEKERKRKRIKEVK
jgi:hypothetical protein